MSADRSVNIQGHAVGTVITTGDHNLIEAKIKAALEKDPLPPPESVDILRELSEIRRILDRVGQDNKAKISRALDDADEEAAKPDGDKKEVGDALERALRFATKGEALVKEAETLTPHLKSAVSWLGANWTQLLSAVGLGS